MKVSLVVLTLATLLSMRCQAQDAPPDVIGGTLIMALGNGNGVVVVTDSMQTYQTPQGNKQLPEPGQKLIRVDDTTVCAIAGAAKIPVEGFPDFFTHLAGIVSQLSELFQKVPKPLPLRRKAQVLSAAVQLQYSVLADLREALTPTQYEAGYPISMILAGYDFDGTYKIVTIDLIGLPETYPSGAKRWSFREKIEETRVADVFESELRGIPSTAQDVLNHPDKHPNDPVIHKYSRAMSLDHGKSLTPDDLLALGKVLERTTSDADPRVGGENQIAVFSEGKLISFSQPQFSPAPPPKAFDIVSDSNLPANAFKFEASDVQILWLRCRLFGWHELKLEDNIFIDSAIVDSSVEYDGGFYFISGTTQIENCTLVLGPHVSPKARSVRDLTSKFRWKDVVSDKHTANP